MARGFQLTLFTMAPELLQRRAVRTKARKAAFLPRAGGT
jgi:hypothetical protein